MSQRIILQRIVPMAFLLMSGNLAVYGQHEHSGPTSPVTAPKIFLDKSPKIVEYQLSRLSNEQLLLVERVTTDKKYAPVFSAILLREGMSPAYREEALAGLVQLNQSDPVSELTAALQAVKGDEPTARGTVASLAKMLLTLELATLAANSQGLVNLVEAAAPLQASAGYAALIVAGPSEEAWNRAVASEQLPQLLEGIPLIPSAAVRNKLHASVLHLFDTDQPLDIRRAALTTLASIPGSPELTFALAAEQVEVEELRAAAIRALLSVPAEARRAETSLKLVEWLVLYAEATPPPARTTPAFLDAMALVDQLLASAPTEQAKLWRGRLRETVVRVVRVHTIREEMRYDLPYFAVEAGRPVQVVLINEDLMPHNLVVTVPGALQEVAELGLELGPVAGFEGKEYVPVSDKVLYATHMVAADEQESLTFTAPTVPGEYPYVCTFPRHWMRMYGVMVVVDDLDAWLKNPITPVDPIGSNRQFVQSWTIEEFSDGMDNSLLDNSLRGRSKEIGQRLFVEATCAQCHKLGDSGLGNVGPNLGQVFARWKGDSLAVLREILDPSHTIDEKYAVRLVLTVDGKTITGLVVNETKESLSLMENPEALQPTVIPQENIEQMVKTSTSMMPKGLLDRFSRDEILEILAYIRDSQNP
jgi:putative heme-binding domain-containing protein